MSRLQTLDDLALELNDGADMRLIEDCRFCTLTHMQDEMVRTPEGWLCLTCNEKYCQQEAEKIAEKNFVKALRALSADKIQTLRFMAANIFEGFEDKNNAENVVWFANCGTEALESKKS